MSDAGTNRDNLHCHVRLNCPICGKFMRRLGLISKIRIEVSGGGKHTHICRYATFDYISCKWSHKPNASVSISGDEPEYAPRSCSPDYAYRTIDEYEEIVGCEVSDAFRIGWDMARTTSDQLNLLANAANHQQEGAK